jgi:hypothetical protein
MATLEEGSKPWPRGRTCAPSFSEAVLQIAKGTRIAFSSARLTVAGSAISREAQASAAQRDLGVARRDRAQGLAAISTAPRRVPRPPVKG